MPRRKGNVFNYFNVKKRNGKDIYSCSFCELEYIKHATRMTKHLKVCPKCPPHIKMTLVTTTGTYIFFFIKLKLLICNIKSRLGMTCSRVPGNENRPVLQVINS